MGFFEALTVLNNPLFDAVLITAHLFMIIWYIYDSENTLNNIITEHTRHHLIIIGACSLSLQVLRISNILMLRVLLFLLFVHFALFAVSNATIFINIHILLVVTMVRIQSDDNVNRNHRCNH